MKKMTTEEFIIKALKVHGDNFDYSKVDYKGSKEKVLIMCSNGHEFYQTPNDHLNNHGCKICSGWGQLQSPIKFQKRLKKIYGDLYDFSISSYNGWDNSFKIICPFHGEIDVIPTNFINKKSGCPSCGNENRSHPFTLTLDGFIERASETHNGRYNYSNSKYINFSTKLEIICDSHGSFFQTPKDHIIQSQGCPKCRISKGEKEIERVLNSYDVSFSSQHRFEGCFNKRPLPFDFYLPQHNMCIEFDGEQHISPLKIFGGKKGFNYTKHNDEIKNKYCLKEGIQLLRIPHDELFNIEKILINKLNLK